VKVLWKEFIPEQGDIFGCIDGVAERDFLFENGFAGNERVGKRRGGFDGFTVMADAGVMLVSLIGADEIGANEFLDADVEAGEVDGLNLIGALAVGELGLVFGRQGEAGVEPLELDFLGDGGVER
jgi:hypothetical protein